MKEIGAANQENKFNDLVIDIMSSMAEKMEPPLTPECCIYRVPLKVRKANEEAYSPRAVSIGPYHNGDSKLKKMENLKLRYLKSFLQRGQIIRLQDYIAILKEKEGDVRRSYAEAIQLSSDDFVKMTLFDACFIIELFFRFTFKDWSEEDRVLFKPMLRNDIIMDLLLLENQLPFFVLEHLFSVTFRTHPNPNVHRFSFIELTLNYFEIANPLKNRNILSIKHFTDLFRMFNLPPSPEQLPERLHLSVKFQLPSASELHEAGVKFKPIEDRVCFLNLKYEKGVLEIPPFKANDETETLFRNILALEECHYPKERYVQDYFFLLDCLVNTAKDVEILGQKKILINRLGNNEALATMVNNCCKNLTHSSFNSNYLDICRQLNDFCVEPWHRSKATLRRDYFSSPWKTASSIAAILLLFMTLIQTICSVVSLFKGEGPEANI